MYKKKFTSNYKNFNTFINKFLIIFIFCRFLMDRLDMHRDNWRNIPLSLKLEDTSEQSAASKPAIFKISKVNSLAYYKILYSLF